MNKLAVLAFALLVSLSTLMWYLANGSLNEYLKSQIELQGHYYSKQEAHVNLTDFSSNTGIGKFEQLNLANLKTYQAKNAVVIDKAHVELERQPTQALLTIIKSITINKLTLNVETRSGDVSNIAQLIERIKMTLVHDYPESYPNISAKLYAQKNPQLNAVEYAQNNPQAGPIVEHTKTKKQRGKPQPKTIIAAININTVELNIINDGIANKVTLHDVDITAIGGKQGMVSNQLGGEVLLALLNLVNQG